MRNGRLDIVGVVTRAFAHFQGVQPRVSQDPLNAMDRTLSGQVFSSEMARAEGWDIFDCGVHEDGSPHVEIQRVDEPMSGSPVFAGDAEAWDHVAARARQGSALHLCALQMVDPVERLLIESRCGAWTVPLM